MVWKYERSNKKVGYGRYPAKYPRYTENGALQNSTLLFLTIQSVVLPSGTFSHIICGGLENTLLHMGTVQVGQSPKHSRAILMLLCSKLTPSGELYQNHPRGCLAVNTRGSGVLVLSVRGRYPVARDAGMGSGQYPTDRAGATELELSSDLERELSVPSVEY